MPQPHLEKTPEALTMEEGEGTPGKGLQKALAVRGPVSPFLLAPFLVPPEIDVTRMPLSRGGSLGSPPLSGNTQVSLPKPQATSPPHRSPGSFHSAK